MPGPVCAGFPNLRQLGIHELKVIEGPCTASRLHITDRLVYGTKAEGPVRPPRTDFVHEIYLFSMVLVCSGNLNFLWHTRALGPSPISPWISDPGTNLVSQWCFFIRWLINLFLLTNHFLQKGQVQFIFSLFSWIKME